MNHFVVALISLTFLFFGSTSTNADLVLTITEGTSNSVLLNVIGSGTYSLHTMIYSHGITDVGDITLTVVPEPTSFAMFGIAMLGMSRRRRKR